MATRKFTALIVACGFVAPSTLCLRRATAQIETKVSAPEASIGAVEGDLGLHNVSVQSLSPSTNLSDNSIKGADQSVPLRAMAASVPIPEEASRVPTITGSNMIQRRIQPLSGQEMPRAVLEDSTDKNSETQPEENSVPPIGNVEPVGLDASGAETPPADNVAPQQPQVSETQEHAAIELANHSAIHLLLDPTRRSEDAQEFESFLRRKIVGQDDAVQMVTEIYQMFLAGLNPPGRPVGNLLFLGPTGSGKTRVVEAVAESLFGDARAVIKIDCAEFQQSHEIAKLIGSPPGYLGHRETHPLLTQEALNQWHTEKLKLTVLLFDEIEKASDALWQLLLGILDKATLTLGDNRRVDLSQCLIVMTSNLGAKEMAAQADHVGFKYSGHDEESMVEMDAKNNQVAKNAAGSKFSPEFMNRIDKVVVFKTLREEQLRKILDIELGFVQQRILMATGNNQFVFTVSQRVKDFLLEEGTDLKYGARHLKRAIERNLVFPLANLVATGQIKMGDLIAIDLPAGSDHLTFTKEAEGQMVPVLLEKYGPETAVPAAVRATRSKRDKKTASLLDHK